MTWLILITGVRLLITSSHLQLQDFNNLAHCSDVIFFHSSCSFCHKKIPFICFLVLTLSPMMFQKILILIVIWTLGRPCYNLDIFTIFIVWQLFYMKLDPGTGKCLIIFLNPATIYFVPLIWSEDDTSTRGCHLSQYAITHWI